MITTDITGRRIAITGAGRGLGEAMAVAFADQGAELILLGRTAATLAATRDTITRRTGRAPLAVACDLADTASVAAAAGSLAAQLDRLDALINNGAFWLPGPLADLTTEDIVQVVNSQITGAALLTQRLAPLLLKSAAPDIVNIVSTSGVVNTRLLGASVPFYAAKHGQTGLTNGLRQEMAGTPIRVIGVYPPDIEDLSPPDGAAWNAAAAQPKAAKINERNVVEAVQFAITRPRNCTIATIVLDFDAGGTYQ